MLAARQKKTAVLDVVFVGCLLGLGLLLGHAPLIAGESPSTGKVEKRLVVLYSMPLDFPATEMVEKGIKEALAADSRFSVQMFSEYLDLSRFRDTGQRQALADLLRQRYGGELIDLVISVDVPATNFLMEKAETVFPGVPVVACDIPGGLEESIAASSLRDRVSVVLESPLVAQRLVESALLLKPETKYAVLISGAFENDKVRAVALREAFASYRHRFELIDLTGLSLGETLDRCRNLPKDTVIFFSTLFVDARGRNFVPKNVISSISDYTDAPIFGVYDSYLGSGIVGGPMTSMRLQGEKAARIALRFLSGESSGKPFFDYGAGTTVTLYDWRQLKRHQISESLLPPEAKVLYREATLWELYRNYIIAAVVLFLMQSLLLVGLVFNLRRRKKAEVALRESQQELKTLAGRLISSQEEELSRLSREFHDDIAQRLAAAAIEIGALEIQSCHLEGPLLGKIVFIKEQIIGLSTDVHAISRELHPTILKDVGLERAIKSLCASFSDREGVMVDIHFDVAPDNIGQDAALCLYRVVQEGLRNIAKHAHARHVSVFINGSMDALVLTVADDGVGFEPKCVRHTPGIGLASMRERVQYAAGDFVIHSASGQGTTISVSIPLQRGKYEKADNIAG